MRGSETDADVDELGGLLVWAAGLVALVVLLGGELGWMVSCSES